MTDGPKDLRVVALRTGALYEAVLPRRLDPSNTLAWKAVDLPGILPNRVWRGIAPVFDKSARMSGAEFARGYRPELGERLGS